MRMNNSWIAILLAALAGCGTTRMTDTQRTATEQLLVSNAIDQAVSGLDFQALADKTVYFDPQFLDGTVDRGYLVSSLRQQLLAAGCILQEDRAKATYVAEVRSGGVGTDRHALLVGIPQINVPTFVPGQPSQIPEIPLAKKTDQEGVAKIAVFVYNRLTGRPVWQSGVVEAMSTSRDTWILGAGPFQKGTIRNGTQFAGEQISLPILTDVEGKGDRLATSVSVTSEATWPTDAQRLTSALDPAHAPQGKLTFCDLDQPMLGLPPLASPPFSEGKSPWFKAVLGPEAATSSAAPSPPASKPPASPAMVLNQGGQAETEPGKIVISCFSSKPGTASNETERNKIIETSMGFKPDG